MISRENYKSINIHIVTFKDNLQTKVESLNEERRNCNTMLNKNLICSICLNNSKYNKNTADDDDKRTLKLYSDPKNCEYMEKPKARSRNENKLNSLPLTTRNKAIQTLPTDLNKNLSLLNEVLTVFQNKKKIDSVHKLKTAIVKDACISTDDISQPTHSKLSVDKVFQFSIDDAIIGRNNKFTIITSHEDFVRSRYSQELPKHKSSSIPQMKLEELKYSMKEKTQSKDAIEEVNRMFATVKRNKRCDTLDDSNRPLVRSGPRILPVVKTREENTTITQLDSEVKITTPYKYCLTNDFLSSGDSCEHNEYCHHKQNKYDKCVYMMCCHYKNSRRMRAGVVCCDRCRDEWKFRCNHDRDDVLDEDN